MFKKLLTIMAVAVFAFCMDTDAQDIQTVRNINAPKTSKGMITSKLNLNEDEYWWGYFDGNYAGRMGLGRGSKTQIPQKYDAATCLPAGFAAVANKEIRGISFTFPNSKNIKDVKIWIANKYPQNVEEDAVRFQSVEDITGYQNADDQINEIRFDKPYFVEPDKDVFIGYSFTVVANEEQGDKFPILLTGPDAETHNQGLLVRFGGDGNIWKDCTPREQGDLAIRILVSGFTADNAAGINSSFNTQTILKTSNIKIPVEIQNAGTEDISNLELSVNVDGNEQVVPVTPSKKISGMSSKYNFDLNISLPDKTGYLPVTITISKVNGKENTFLNRTCEGSIIVVPEKVEHKVLFEEFTGMWCGWCPRGMVALENIKKDYGDRVVRIACHMNDPLSCKDYKEAIRNNQAAPSANVDRTLFEIDPYYGYKTYGEIPMGIKNEIDKFFNVIPAATVKAGAYLDGTNLKVKADVNFLYTGPSQYAVGYVITEDGMQDDSWVQNNYYSGKNYSEDPLLDALTKQKGEIEGVIFNEVAMAAKGIKNGINGSIPEMVEENKTVTHEESFNLLECKYIQDTQKLNVCVLLFDKQTGVIVNADCLPLSQASGIEGVRADNEMSEEVARYTIDGRRISAPEKGINIIKYSDGKTKKVIVR